MARQAQCHRVRSALALKVNVFEGKIAGFHVNLPKQSSGQLPFPGLCPGQQMEVNHTRLATAVHL